MIHYQSFLSQLTLFLFLKFATVTLSDHTSATPSVYTRQICLANGSFCDARHQMHQQKSDHMLYQHLGHSGLLVSRLSYGAWVTFGTQIGEEKAFQIMKYCYEHGVNTFDNAEAYANGEAETIMGKVLQRFWKSPDLDVDRDDLVITTKIFFGTYRPEYRPNRKGLSRKHIIGGLKASLSRLQLDYVDVVFAHRMDPHTPMEEIVRAFNYVIDQGMAHYWCTSEWNADDIRQAYNIAKDLRLMGPVCEQPQYNMLHRERFEVEYAPLYRDHGMGTTIWSSLASGVLTGKYNDGIPEGSRLSLDSVNWLRDSLLNGDRYGNWDILISRIRKLQTIANKINCSMPQLAIAWCLRNPHVSTIILGATKMHQLSDNLGSLKCLQQLSDDTIQEIELIMQNKPALPIDWTTF